ncbi:SRP72 [[Candida] subhashii]|uniref:Signal recognition particle subunit SRP72 n=1 Tax=[Candida] subhashii TaxID=561895 RepID=A0A8J5QIX6_9ASCO|nr:SRP72 [[Candida] subhashii]KAG7663882.1 SRP72 [[Candida] subhashii]
MSNSIADAFKKLNVSPDSTPSEHQKIFRVSYEYLSKVKHFNDLKAFNNCLVALINIDKYQRAYDVIRKVPANLIESSILEVCYVYYKLGKSEELIKLYESRNVNSEGLEIGLNHILAQTYYKIGSHEKALALYHDLIENNKYDNQLDLIINERAIISQLNFNSHGQNKSTHSIDQNLDNYDLLFNEALIELSNNNIPNCLHLLESAQKLCKLNTDWSPEDLLSELLPINITIAYVYDLLGDSSKSLEILQENDIDSINDSMLKLIIKNNIYSKSDNKKSIGLIERDLSFQENLHKLNQKLTKWQYQVILKNNIMLKFATGTLGKSQLNNKFIQKFLNDFPGDLFPLAYKIFINLDISFNDLHDSTKLKSIGRKLIKFINNQKQNDQQQQYVAVLLLVYLNFQIGSFDQSLCILEEFTTNSISQDKLIPGIVGTLINVYEKTHSTKKLTELLIKLANKFLETPVEVFSNDGDYYNTAKIIAFKALNQGHKEISSKLFQYLNSINQEDHLISSILSNSNIDLYPINELVSPMPISEILSVDLDTLIPSAAKSTKPIIKKVSKITKKKQKPKFGPNKIIKPQEELSLDDERWLPMKLRSYYKPTKKDKKKTGGQQGIVEHSATPVLSHATPTSSGSGGKKKKKKGKK